MVEKLELMHQRCAFEKLLRHDSGCWRRNDLVTFCPSIGKSQQKTQKQSSSHEPCCSTFSFTGFTSSQLTVNDRFFAVLTFWLFPPFRIPFFPTSKCLSLFCSSCKRSHTTIYGTRSKTRRKEESGSKWFRFIKTI
jgi:hypothetical protein